LQLKNSLSIFNPMVNQFAIRRILLADDDEDDAFLFEQVLLEVNSGFELVVATNGIQVIDILTRSQEFDIVFLDINMPLKNGLQCLQEIPGLLGSKQIPVICFSTSGDRNIIAKAKDLGAAGYVTKPVSYNKYVNLLKEVLRLNKEQSLMKEFYLFSEV